MGGSPLEAREVGILVANTIMRCDIILMADKLRMPSVWVIHESWPQDQLDHYAKEVFMCRSESVKPQMNSEAGVLDRRFMAFGSLNIAA